MTLKNVRKFALCSVMFFWPQFVYAAVNVAVVVPLDGEYKIFGEQIVQGVQSAVELINHDGGLNGQEINMITVNDPCDDSGALTVANMLAQNSSDKDKISLIIGPYCSNNLQAVSEIYSKAKIIQIVPVAVSKPQSSESSPEGLIKLAGYKERQSEDFYHFYKRLFDGKQVALIYDSLSRDLVDLAYAIQQEFKSHDEIEYIKAYNYASFDDDYDDLVDKVLEEKNEVAYILGTPQQTAEVASLIKSENVHFPIFANKYKAQQDYDEIMGRYADTIFYLGLHSMEDLPEMAETIVNLRLKGLEPEGLGMYGYLSVKFWEALVKKAASFDYAKVVQAIKSGTTSFPWGNIGFDDGVPQHLFHYSIYIRQKGQYTQIY